MRKMNEIYADIQEAADAVESYGEIAGEVRAQYGSEMSLYGDAWPGAVYDLAEAEACEKRAIKRYAALLLEWGDAFVGPPVPGMLVLRVYEDLPF